MIQRLENADLVKQIRKQYHLTQAELAEILGVSTSKISAWENSKEELPKSATFMLTCLHQPVLAGSYVGGIVRVLLFESQKKKAAERLAAQSKANVVDDVVDEVEEI